MRTKEEVRTHELKGCRRENGHRREYCEQEERTGAEEKLADEMRQFGDENKRKALGKILSFHDRVRDRPLGFNNENIKLS